MVSNRKQAHFHAQVMILRVQSLILIGCGAATLLMYLGLVLCQVQAAFEAVALLKMAASFLGGGILAVEFGRGIERYLLKHGLISPAPGRKGIMNWLERIKPLEDRSSLVWRVPG